MCPLYPVHLVLTYGALVLVVWMAGLGAVVGAASQAAKLKVRYHLNNITTENNGFLDITEGETQQVTFYLDDLSAEAAAQILIQESSPDGLEHIAVSKPELVIEDQSTSANKDEGANMNPSLNSHVKGKFNLTGKFLGFSNIKLVLNNSADEADMKETEPVIVKVQRGYRKWDKIFIHVVILMVIFAYINMGCAIDLEVIKATVKRPIAPAIGLASQYIFMPLCAYGMGYLLFSDNPSLWLGLFLTGCSPGGGGSNMWTYVLGGSLDLSVTMTFISTVAAFLALPAWVYGLAHTIFPDGYFSKMPYRNIAMLALGLVVPLSMGLGIKKVCPKGAEFLKKMLKPLSIFFIVFVMTFGVFAYFYIFAFFDWKVAIVGMCLPWLGFIFGAVASVVSRRSWEEVIAISIETGVQNTGLSIGILKIALGDVAPLGDIAMIIPVAVATMTPVPLTIALIAKKIMDCRNRRDSKDLAYAIDPEMKSPCLGSPSGSESSDTPLTKECRLSVKA
ncbi:unnamed protein product [Meganyctiphanes norvegica]|uniref:Uncharacterized protein n=1 Tax=Meganyctiphanes norvegica TaxID=48144 RepID=A0AAV2Q5C8_MEGNR